MKDNILQFNENGQFSDNGNLGLLHIDYYMPIPIKGSDVNILTTFSVGEYVGTSFRIKLKTNSYTEANKYLNDSISEGKNYTMIYSKIAVGRL